MSYNTNEIRDTEYYICVYKYIYIESRELDNWWQFAFGLIAAYERAHYFHVL